MSASDPSRTVLLVEDDPVVRTFLADNLTADGYTVLVADTLRDGLRVLEYAGPDLAIVDVALPDGRAAAGRVGVPVDGDDADARQPCLPAAAQARGPRRPVRRERVGRRVSPGRRARGGSGGVSATIVLLFAFAVTAVAYARERRVGALVPQASPELHRPLFAARL